MKKRAAASFSVDLRPFLFASFEVFPNELYPGFRAFLKCVVAGTGFEPVTCGL